ncbi:MAG: hypothetical protein ACQR33_06150 [Candidatus Saccharibacteria bacterium]
MSPNQSGPSLLQILQQQLEVAHQHNQTGITHNGTGARIQVPGLGKTFASAYEQLRNAAEYTEEHLLLQRAIRRFYNRSLSLASRKALGNVGEELIVELTQAGYVQNNTFGVHVSSQLNQLTDGWLNVYWQLRDANISRETASEWILDILSVSTEELLNPHYHLNAIATFAYNHYLQSMPRETFLSKGYDAAHYELCLYIAAHKALLKSDIALVRHDLMNMYQQNPAQVPAFIEFNKQVDALFNAPLTQIIERSVSKYGAPIRVLKSLIEAHPEAGQLLNDPDQFLAVYERTTLQDYKDVGRRLNKGIIKSITFIFITKIIIGVGVEVPYDLIVVGTVSFLPLGINLLVPPLYMAGLKLGLRAPSPANAQALRNYMGGVLYPSETMPAPVLSVSTKTASLQAKVLYTIFFFVPFAITLYGLSLLHFNVIQAIIFFAFLSTASFLGFRLSRMIREMELIAKQQGLLSVLRDFFYLPFIIVGQWLSRKYARVNVVAFILDMAIELPLKTILRLVRQWTRFLNEKHEEMY